MMGVVAKVVSNAATGRQSWPDWRRQVVALIRCDLPEVLSDVSEEDIDWGAWRVLYEEGRDARAAVDRAFVRDF
jgi:hypothetical protein